MLWPCLWACGLGPSSGVTLGELLGKSADALGVRVLRIRTQYALEASFAFALLAEIELGATSADLDCPAFRAVGVSREKGFIGAGPKTNVELEEVSRRGTGFSRIDVKELSAPVRADTVRHVLAYKFLHSGYKLELRVTKHADVAVLVAAVDAAVYDVIVTPEGKHVVQAKMRIRNTERQFLRVHLPPGATVWSTSVAYTPIKPAIDDSGLLMIPLANASDTSFDVIVTYVTIVPTAALVGSGTIDVVLPVLDLAISHVFVQLQLPTHEHKFEAVSGAAFRCVDRFSAQPPAFSPPHRAPVQSRAPSRPVRRQRPAASNRLAMRRRSISCLESSASSMDSMSEEFDEDDDEDDVCDFDSADHAVKGKDAVTVTATGAGASSTGAIPVEIHLPRIDNSVVETFRFERLLPSASEALPPASISFTRK